MKIKLGHKLGAGFLAAIILGAAVNSYNISSFGQIRSAQKDIIEDQFISVSTLLKVKSDLLMSRRNLLECVVDQQIEKVAYDVKSVDQALEDMNDTWKLYGTSISNEGERAVYEQTGAMLDAYMASIREAITALKTNQEISGEKLAVLEKQCDEIITLLDSNVEQNSDALNSAASTIFTVVDKARKITVVWGCLAILTSSIVAVYIAINIIKNTRRILAVLNKAAEGDLTQQITVKTQDEMAEIAQASNELITALSGMTKEIMQVAGEVAASSEELLSSAEETNASVDQVTVSITHLADGTIQQVKAIQETDSSIISVAESIEEVADNAAHVNMSAKKMVELANNGLIQSQTASSTIIQIKETTDKTVEVVGELGGKSDKIGEFVEVIKGLANQTNLLALNAAIEAARAGEQGKGFAVVADEVKVLAEQSASSAEEIAKLVSEIQTEMTTVMKAMAASAKEVNNGVEVVEIAGKSFVSIADEIEEVVKQIEEVSKVTSHLKQNAGAVVENMKTINTVAEETSASTEEISASAEEQKHSTGAIVEASEELAQLAMNLQSVINKFKIK